MAFQIKVVDYNNPEDAQNLIFLLNEYAKDPMGRGKELSTEVKNSLCIELAKQANALSLIAYENDKPVALANCFFGFSTFKAKPLLNIHDMIVHKEHRSKGVAQKLMAKVEEIARSKECCKLTLEVLSNNTKAQNSYVKFGFTGYELKEECGQALFWEKPL